MGTSKQGDDTHGDQKGAQAHAEGEHGAATRSRDKHQVGAHGARSETHSKREANDPNRHGKQGGESHEAHDQALAGDESDGQHRLYENRKQHDDADRDQGKNRLDRDIDRHGHDREQFQTVAGRETHPSLPQDGADTTVKSPSKGGK